MTSLNKSTKKQNNLLKSTNRKSINKNILWITIIGTISKFSIIVTNSYLTQDNRYKRHPRKDYL